MLGWLSAGRRPAANEKGGSARAEVAAPALGPRWRGPGLPLYNEVTVAPGVPVRLCFVRLGVSSAVQMKLSDRLPN